MLVLYSCSITLSRCSIKSSVPQNLKQVQEPWIGVGDLGLRTQELSLAFGFRGRKLGSKEVQAPGVGLQPPAVILNLQSRSPTLYWQCSYLSPASTPLVSSIPMIQGTPKCSPDVPEIESLSPSYPKLSLKSAPPPWTVPGWPHFIPRPEPWMLAWTPPSPSPAHSHDGASFLSVSLFTSLWPNSGLAPVFFLAS